MDSSRLTAVRIFCSHLERSVSFYENVMGWPLVDSGEGFALFHTGRVPTLIEEEDPNGPDADLIGRFTALSYQTKNIQKAYDTMTRMGVVFEGEPAKQAWGGYLAHFRDPDSNILTLVQNP